MALLDILTYPAPLLSKEAQQIETVDKDIQQLIENMLETMYAVGGIGLAAPQVNRPLQLAVIDLSPTRDAPHILINPALISGEEEISVREACLSVPNTQDTVKRYRKIVIKTLDMNGRPTQIAAEDALAICFQHEMDHLKGTLFIDYLSPFKRSRIERRLKNSQRIDRYAFSFLWHI